MVVDNTLLSGLVAEGRADGALVGAGDRDHAPLSTRRCCERSDMVAALLPVGDGVLVGVRR